MTLEVESETGDYVNGNVRVAHTSKGWTYSDGGVVLKGRSLRKLNEVLAVYGGVLSQNGCGCSGYWLELHQVEGCTIALAAVLTPDPYDVQYWGSR